MTISRRTILMQGSVIGAGVVASNVPGFVALAQAQPPLRRSLHGMALNDPILSAWRDGVGLLKAATNGNLTWAKFAAIHGNANAFNLCPHGNWYFLPWHRAYLLMYERVVRKLTSSNDFALPYWDWTEDRQMPQAFMEQTYNGKPNPLYEPQRDVTPTDSLSDEIVGPAVISEILTEAPFETFGTSRPAGQNNTNQSWINDEFSGTMGTLESNPHNNVHNFVGGIMRSAQSSLDAIFMMHHCNIDRIWWVWNQGGQADTPDQLWTGMTFQNNFFDTDGNPSSATVSDVLVPEPLGYTYNAAPTAPPSPPPSSAPTIASYDKLKSLYAMPNLSAATAAGVATYTAQNTQQATGAKHLEVAVNVDANVLGNVAHRRTAPSGSTALRGLEATRAAIAAGPRALCFIRDVATTDHEHTLYRVFINCDYLTPQTPVTDRHYVGTFGFFGGPHGSHGGTSREPRKPSIAVDLTQAIQRVYGSQPSPSGHVRVQIQPVPVRSKVAKVGTATPARVEVAVVGA